MATPPPAGGARPLRVRGHGGPVGAGRRLAAPLCPAGPVRAAARAAAGQLPGAG